MKVIDCEQQTPEWFLARTGIPTASNFDKIITTKGEESKQRTKYLYQLAGEIVSENKEMMFQSSAMLRGVELENEAIELYEMIHGVDIEKIGFCLDNTENYGCSPDGLIGGDGLIEIKCPNMATHVEYMINNKIPATYYQQVQGQLLITDREWCDFISYYPGIKPFIIRVEKDKPFTKRLADFLYKFCDDLKEIVNKIK